MLFTATEYNLQSPLWQYVIIHLHLGDYHDLTMRGNDRHFHLAVPYMFDEEELVEFLRKNINRLQVISERRNNHKRLP